MKRHRPELFMLAGLWISFVVIIVAGSTLLTPTRELAQSSPAILYKIAMNEELSHATNVPYSGKVIAVNLDSMKLSLYDGDKLVKEFSVLSRGREGTFWETPTGMYQVETKEPKHFSSIGGTWMPYSMQFYGNFFIHGWPTYPDGTDVPRGYSGGCIRLSTDDAREVYEFASIGTRVYVAGGLSKDSFATSSRYYMRAPENDSGNSEISDVGPSLPHITAPSFIAADVESGTVFWERNANSLQDPMGLTAIATALTALETVDQYKLVRMSELLLGKSVLRKHVSGVSDELPIGTLIYPLMFSANDTAAKVFALEHGTKSFVSHMNEKSTAIGMNDTTFGGPLSSDHSTTTARDLFTLLRYVDQSKHFLIDVSEAADRTFVSTTEDIRYRWENKNPWIMSGDGAYQGGIADVSGPTENAMVIFSLPVSEFGNRRVAFVVLGSTDLRGDIERLQTFVTEHFLYGIERDNTDFIRESNEPTPSLLKKVQDILDLRHLLEQEISYERDV